MLFESIKQETNKCFAILVVRWDAATLWLLIRQYTVSEAAVVSDQRASYSIIKNMLEGYQRKTFDHNLHFTEPETEACKNTTES